MTEYTREEAVALGHLTFVLGPAQLPVQETPRGAYILNCITDPERRGEGHMNRLLDVVYYFADRSGITLLTHPDTPELAATLTRAGWTETAYTWEGRPLMRRNTQPFYNHRENPDLVDLTILNLHLPKESNL